MIILYLLLYIKHFPAKMMNKRTFCGGKTALTHEIERFMTVLRERLSSLVYYSAINILVLEGDRML